MVEQIVPLSFSTILGQDKAKKILQRSLSSARVAHAYLFRGPDGVGKQLCARVVAARLNCLEAQGSDPCGTCPSCRKYLSSNHPDISIIRPDGGTIKINRIRELSRSLSYPPYESKVRVVILEDVHTMRTEAANSLLKTLEEPPQNNVLILTAESSKEVLATIVSRCQTIPFYGLTVEQTSSILCTHHPDLDTSDGSMLSRLAEGSPGQALLFKENDLVDVWKSIVAAIDIPAGGTPVSVSQLLSLAERLAMLKENLIPVLALLRIWVRDQMVAAAGSETSEMRSAQVRLEALDRADRQLARNCNRGLVCEVLLFNLQSPLPRVFF